ncbi:MAG TPA: amino acid adenylation domain-containing protein, partial [Longimicrobiaceae bacterium]
MAPDLVHTLFEAQAALRPDAVALVCGSERVTFAELNARANRLAHALRGMGVGPEAPVAVFLPRTPELAVALLAVLKAGGAYVPLDPAYPPARTAFVLEDTGASVVVTHSSVAGRLPAHAARALPLDREAGALARLPGTDPSPLTGPESLAYVIHTSGSTGRPKGVAVEHRSAVALLRWLRREVTEGEREAVLFSTSVCFDVSFAELFGTLCWGGKAVLVEDVLALAGLGEEVRLAHVVPSAAAELVRAGGFPAGLRTVALGGEAVPPVLAREIYARTGVRRVLNLYGPTEDTIVSTCALLSPGQEAPVPVGLPVAGTEVRVLDASLSPAAPGAEGELFTAGAGVARGYLGRPDLTAERFLPDPGAALPGARMYRTGDLGRLRPDGALEHLGRVDLQAKVRGHRVEPGEVEAALLEHPRVAEAAVAALGEDGGGAYLAAYVVGADGEPPPRTELREWLLGRLPEHMVPTAWAALPALPRAPNGKVDRLALPPADPWEPEGRAPLRTPVEELLAGIWSAVLGVEAVGARDDFYALGGHSLRAAQVSARVRKALGVDLPLPAVLRLPTVEAQAAEAERLLAGEMGPEVRIPRAPRDGPLPLSSAQEAVWFLERLAPGMRSYQFQAAVRFRGRLDPGALRRALGEIVRRHEIFRTTFPEVAGAPVQRVHPPGLARLPVVELRRAPAERREAELGRALGAELDRPFRSDALPLVRWTLYRVAADEHVLLCVEHHLVHDGWSFGVFLHDLVALYAAFARGEPSPLPEPAIQFADYAAWQRARTGSAAEEAHLDFWRRRLA